MWGRPLRKGKPHFNIYECPLYKLRKCIYRGIELILCSNTRDHSIHQRSNIFFSRLMKNTQKALIELLPLRLGHRRQSPTVWDRLRRTPLLIRSVAISVVPIVQRLCRRAKFVLRHDAEALSCLRILVD